VLVSITPPIDAPVGSNFAGLLVKMGDLKEASSEVTSSGGTKVGVDIRALVQIYPRVPGDIVNDVEISKPRVADTFLFTGNRFVVYEVDIENTGNVHSQVSGRTVVNSMFGNSVTDIKMRDMLVLRGSKRTARFVWTNPPKFGRFSATATILDGEQKSHKLKFPKVLILPPWWWFAIAIGAIVFGVAGSWWRRRDDWRQYLDEDDWDESWDDDYDGELV
jgi:hypothetical protein